MRFVRSKPVSSPTASRLCVKHPGVPTQLIFTVFRQVLSLTSKKPGDCIRSNRAVVITTSCGLSPKIQLSLPGHHTTHSHPLVHLVGVDRCHSGVRLRAVTRAGNSTRQHDEDADVLKGLHSSSPVDDPVPRGVGELYGVERLFCGQESKCDLRALVIYCWVRLTRPLHRTLFPDRSFPVSLACYSLKVPRAREHPFK